nr:MAG: hypothetical protein AM324_09970 [Candidatus Thorarchaeota archaeon SMTZ1-83]
MRRFVLLSVAILVVLACSESELLKVVEFQDAEGNSPPITSDVVTIDNDVALVYEDNAVAMVSFDVHFYEVPFGSSEPPGYGAHLDRYVVTFSSVEEDEFPPSHEGALNVIIPPGEEKAVAFVLVPAEAKTVSPLVDLINGGELRTKATVEFWGTEDKTGKELHASGQLDVNFANWADE